jgi:hypothetical protein
MTNPNQARNFRGTVRSQAMRVYRHNHKCAKASALDDEQGVVDLTSPETRAVHPKDSSGGDDPYATLSISLVPQPLTFVDLQHGAPAVQFPALTPDKSSALSFRPRFSSVSIVTGYEQSSSHEANVYHLLLDNIAQIPQVGYTVDAFPAFEHLDLDSARLIQQCKFPVS